MKSVERLFWAALVALCSWASSREWVARAVEPGPISMSRCLACHEFKHIDAPMSIGVVGVPRGRR